jgi:hyperosmotically inducible protein
LKRIALVLLLYTPLLALCGETFAQSTTPAPDNSGVNARDRDNGAMTAGEQSNAKSDVELTRKIRRAVVKDHSLSMMAHNVKIIAVNGAVTLRGPVKTEQEKDAIAAKATAIAGADKVDNQLEVKEQ